MASWRRSRITEDVIDACKQTQFRSTTSSQDPSIMSIKDGHTPKVLYWKKLTQTRRRHGERRGGIRPELWKVPFPTNSRFYYSELTNMSGENRKHDARLACTELLLVPPRGSRSQVQESRAGDTVDELLPQPRKLTQSKKARKAIHATNLYLFPTLPYSPPVRVNAKLKGAILRVQGTLTRPHKLRDDPNYPKRN